MKPVPPIRRMRITGRITLRLLARTDLKVIESTIYTYLPDACSKMLQLSCRLGICFVLEVTTLRHVASAPDDRQPRILGESRVTHRELAEVESRMSVGLDNSRMLTLKAEPDPNSLVFDFAIAPHSPPYKPELYPTLSPSSLEESSKIVC